MKFENPSPTEGINVSSEHPLKEFVQLLLGITVVSLLTIWLLSLVAGWLALRIPFEYEKRLVQEVDFTSHGSLGSADQVFAEQQRLQGLADRLSAQMNLPEDIEITVHYSQDSTVNALATLGGNIIFFKGLLEQIDSEQTLAAVMAHEIAHIKLRHPIVAVGKGFTVATMAAFISGASGSSAGGWLLGNSAQLSLLSYSREQELAADALAAHALQAEFGNIRGAMDLFALFDDLESESFTSTMPQLYRSHPYSKDRAETLRAMANDMGWTLTDRAQNK